MARLKEARDEAESRNARISKLEQELQAEARQFQEAMRAARSWYEQTIDSTQEQFTRREKEAKRVFAHVDRIEAITGELQRQLQNSVIGSITTKSGVFEMTKEPPQPIALKPR
jgi:hypothetical protein